MYNAKAHKHIVHQWSRESTIGKKFVYSTAFNCIDKKDTSGGVAVYNHYKVSFSHCNKLNKTLNGKMAIQARWVQQNGLQWQYYWFLIHILPCECMACILQREKKIITRHFLWGLHRNSCFCVGRGSYRVAHEINQPYNSLYLASVLWNWINAAPVSNTGIYDQSAHMEGTEANTRKCK